MHKVNRPLIVYLSKSLKVSEKVLQEVRNQLTSCGFLINEYKGGAYDRNLRAHADFTILVPNLPTLLDSPKTWLTNVGKGQYSEVQECCIEDQPAFMYMGEEQGKIMMVKVGEDIDDHFVGNSRDWKSTYGTIKSYAPFKTDLYEFITGYMLMYRQINHINSFLKEDKVYKKLLLLLK